MQGKIRIICLSGVLLMLTIHMSWAQEPEEAKPDTTVTLQDTIPLSGQSIVVTDEEDDAILIETEKTFSGGITKKIPRKAALYAAVLPGLGQVYNGSYWKVPIVYGTFITLGWFANFQNDRYQLFRRANIALTNNLPEENPLDGIISNSNISRSVDQTHRDRDFIYILMAGAYALQIMEAIVDAHLIEFDVSDDLSMELQPSLGQYFASATGGGSFVPAMGASFILNIK